MRPRTIQFTCLLCGAKVAVPTFAMAGQVEICNPCLAVEREKYNSFSEFRRIVKQKSDALKRRSDGALPSI